ncbi:MAG: 3-oxoacyl-ACP reductase FabG [Firmicutes bacterium]|nr:3-oxoacyl-ACP reductase FabG [Bacillota bacterium]
MKLENKVAIVTGGASGIGKAIAKKYIEEGAAAVVICDVNEEKLQQTAAELNVYASEAGLPGKAQAYIVHIGNKEETEAMVQAAAAEYGRIDILVNNAGITRDAQFYKMTDDQFDAVIDVNLRGNYYITKAVLPHMMEKNYGKIVHLASVSAYNGNFGQSNYAASKAALMGMARVQSRELGKYNINVNCIAPGTIFTEMYAAVPEEVREKKKATIPLKRYGTPEDVANLATFLASEDSSYITGQTITIDGGRN